MRPFGKWGAQKNVPDTERMRGDGVAGRTRFARTIRSVATQEGQPHQRRPQKLIIKSAGTSKGAAELPAKGTFCI